MKRYEPISAHLSNALISTEDFIPYKMMNIQLRVNFEAQQDLRAVGPNMDELGDQFAAEMKELFVNNFTILVPDENDAKKMTIEIKESEDKAKFGWYELYNKNRE